MNQLIRRNDQENRCWNDNQRRQCHDLSEMMMATFKKLTAIAGAVFAKFRVSTIACINSFHDKTMDSVPPAATPDISGVRHVGRNSRQCDAPKKFRRFIKVTRYRTKLVGANPGHNGKIRSTIGLDKRQTGVKRPKRCAIKQKGSASAMGSNIQFVMDQRSNFPRNSRRASALAAEQPSAIESADAAVATAGELTRFSQTHP